MIPKVNVEVTVTELSAAPLPELHPRHRQLGPAALIDLIGEHLFPRYTAISETSIRVKEAEYNRRIAYLAQSRQWKRCPRVYLSFNDRTVRVDVTHPGSGAEFTRALDLECFVYGIDD